MRFLHTSDWHLGQTLHNFERTHEHALFLDWLLDTIVAEDVDALLIAGDIFDNANPSASSQRQFYQFLQQAKSRAPHLNIVIIAGNHDSPGRLEAPAPLLEALDITVVGQVRWLPDRSIDLDRLLVPLKRRDGSVGAWCLAVPFLRPGDVPRVDCEGDGYLEGIALLYRQAIDLARERRSPGQPIVALGHCHMAGGEVSTESERRIVIGGVEALSASVFDPSVAYVALGHLHKAQRVAREDHLRYSGSPLPMSFAETDYAHQVVRIDLDAESVRDITEIRVPRAVELLRIPRRPAPLAEVLATLQALDLSETEPNMQPYLEVRVLLDAPEPGLRTQIEAAIENKPVRLAKIETTSTRQTGDDSVAPSLDDLDHLQPEDVFNQLYRSRFGNDAPSEHLSAFAELLHAPAEKVS